MFELIGREHPGPDNFNAAPTENVAVWRVDPDGQNRLDVLRWWLTPYWAKAPTTRYSMFNAKRETIATSPAFREPFARRRCVVPVWGFYEWQKRDSAGGSTPAKLPFFIRPSDAAGLLLAGLWDRWRNRETSEILESFTVVTTAAHPSIEFVHTRQPVMLSRADARGWLDPVAPEDELAAMCEPQLPVGLDAVPVSSHVNNARNKDARCFEPVADPVVLAADPGPAT